MPLMPDIRNCVAFFYPTGKDAKEDTNFLAAGFLLGRDSAQKPGIMYPYIVTNEHVIRGRKKIWLRMNKKTLGLATLEMATDWFATDKKFDIAVASIPAIKFFDLMFTMETELLEDWREDNKKLRIGQGDDVMMLSRIVGQKTRYLQRNLPAMRFGNVALCPEYEELCFITEMRSVAGHSGSPVFVYNFSPLRKHVQPEHPNFGWKLLGINRGHLPQYDPVVPAIDVLAGKPHRRSSTHVVATNMSMCQVVPAWKIKELLHCERLEEDYDELESCWSASDALEDIKRSASRRSKGRQ